MINSPAPNALLPESLPRLSQPKHILVVNYSGFILGDDAIFEGLLGILNAAFGPGLVIEALTAMPERTLQRYPVVSKAHHIYDYLDSFHQRRDVKDMVSRADLIVVGGGDIIEGQLALTVLAALAWLIETPVVFCGVGVLMPESRNSRLMLRWSLKRANFTATRDAGSLKLLHSMGIHRPNIKILPDLAIALKKDGPNLECLLEREGLRLSRPYIVLNLRSPDPQQYKTNWGEPQFETLALTCREVIDRYGYSLVCVSLVMGKNQPIQYQNQIGDDRLLAEFAEQIGRPQYVHVLQADYYPQELATILGGAQFAIGMRLHFLILASSNFVPVIALDYAPKVRAFMQSAGLDQYCLNLADLNSETILGTVDRLENCREIIKQQLVNWHQESQAQLATLGPILTALTAQYRFSRTIKRLLSGVSSRAFFLSLWFYFQAVKFWKRIT